MMSVLISFLLTLRTAARSRAKLQLEVLALRHPLQVLQRTRSRRVRLAKTDRWLWVVLARLWTGWRTALVIVKPETVIAWHRRGFRRWWTWTSRRRLGRLTVPTDVRTLIRTMAQATPRWGAPRIHGELRKLGLDVSETTVAKYMVRPRQPPSQIGDASGTWRSPRIRRRRGRPNRCARRVRGTRRLGYLVHDRDHAFDSCRTTAKAMAIEEVLTAPRAPWQNPFVERFIGSARRECFDHVIVFNEAGLKRLMTLYGSHHERSRTHVSLDDDTPIPRRVTPRGEGTVVAIPEVGGSHYRYERRAA